MDQLTDGLGKVAEGGVVAVMRGVTDETLPHIGDALVTGGITAMEVTADTDGATEKIRTIADRYAGEEVLVGAGTVLDAETARHTLLAGAQFIVTPTLDEGVVRMANRYGVPVVPGVLTPTEALKAYETGADAVKVFPASSVGPGHVSSIHGPLEQIPIIPTGGVDLDNAADYIDAGAIAVGVGSALITDDIVEEHDWEALESRAAALVDTVQQARE